MNTHRLGLYRVISSIVVILAAAVAISGCAGTSSKKEDMSLANEQISIARSDVSNAINAGGNEFAPLQVRSAMDKIGNAEQAMRAKEYSRARQLAEQARVDAQLAESMARAAKAQRAADELREGRRILREELVR